MRLLAITTTKSHAGHVARSGRRLTRRSCRSITGQVAGTVTRAPSQETNRVDSDGGETDRAETVADMLMGSTW